MYIWKELQESCSIGIIWLMTPWERVWILNDILMFQTTRTRTYWNFFSVTGIQFDTPLHDHGCPASICIFFFYLSVSLRYRVYTSRDNEPKPRNVVDIQYFGITTLKNIEIISFSGIEQVVNFLIKFWTNPFKNWDRD